MKNPGQAFRKALSSEHPLQVVGVVNAFAAMMAQQVGFRALYLSGAGVANSSYGLPDLGIINLENILEDARRITAAVDLPLLVDIDTGWGHAFTIQRAIKSMIQTGVAAIHLEDQISFKRCGHRPGKRIVEKNEMLNRIKAAVDAKLNPKFVIIARTDAFAVEGIEKTIERCISYEEGGADALFLEALPALDLYLQIKKVVNIPILANMTEFGLTPLYTKNELASVGVDIILYPLSANRAMNLAALKVFQNIRQHGSQRKSLSSMMSREELYSYLGYAEYEKKLDSFTT